MRFLFSILSLASIAGVLMLLYVSAGSFLKLNRSSDEDKALAAEKAAAMFTRLAQRNGTLARMQANGAPSFGPLNFSSWSQLLDSDQPASATPWQTADTGSVQSEEQKSYAAVSPKPSIIPPSLWDWSASRTFFNSAPIQRSMNPRRVPTPAEEARAVYLKYATPQ